MVLEPPRRLVRALAEGHHAGDTGDAGDRAASWLEELPGLVDAAVARYGLRVERLLQPGGRSSVALLVHRHDGTPAVLKMAPPSAAPALETAALTHWAGLGACRLLEDGSQRPETPQGTSEPGSMVLERLRPEVSLNSLPQAKAMLEAADTVRRLWVEPPRDVPFETVSARTGRHAAMMRHCADDLLRPLVEAALAVRDELLSDSAETVLLHGAFRQAKVLAGERLPWLAVGPEPLIGERAYDVARLARDRLEDLVAANSGAASARRRVAKLADSLDLDRDRLQGWTHFRATAAGTAAVAAGHQQRGELLLEFAGWL
ncbi:aminoglycoside phosphotransferase family protein [Streptomyces sp. NPDC007088]|uniref:aminoglycoside phosphotransferase family protein n=1 Tax=Streptomyces sp. NPDC007088 TaxID=3364773 RepID=UPI0036B02D7E